MKECIWIDWRSPRVQAVCCVAIVILSFMFFCTHHVLKTVYLGYQKSPAAFRSLENDTYGDLVKAALAHRESADRFILESEDKALRWPEHFRKWLSQNEYRNWAPELTCGEPVPLSALILASCRHLLYRWGPVPVLNGLFILYCGLVAMLVLLCARTLRLGPVVAYTGGAMLLVSWPALFMFQRAHVPSAIAAVCIFLYALLRCSGREGMAALFPLSLAICLRPHYAALGLLEVGLQSDFRALARRITTLVVGCIGVSALSFWVVNKIHPEYTLSGMALAFQNYRALYIVEDGGLHYGVSLFGLLKIIRIKALGMAGYSEHGLRFVGGIGVVFSIFACISAFRRRLDLTESLFVACAIAVLFCPVVAVYHLLCLVAPLALTFREDAPDGRWSSYPAVRFGCAFSLVCFPHSLLAGEIVPIVLFGCLLVVLLGTLRRDPVNSREQTAVVCRVE